MSSTLPLNDDPQLVDLPEQQKPSKIEWLKLIITPKLVILFILASVFVGNNIYIEMTRPPVNKSGQAKEVEMSPELQERFIGYAALTVVFFCVFIFLKRKNDAAEEKRIAQELRQKQQMEKMQTQKQKRIQEKANKILLSMDQFGNQVEQPQTAKANSDSKTD